MKMKIASVAFVIVIIVYLFSLIETLGFIARSASFVKVEARIADISREFKNPRKGANYYLNFAVYEYSFNGESHSVKKQYRASLTPLWPGALTTIRVNPDKPREILTTESIVYDLVGDILVLAVYSVILFLAYKKLLKPKIPENSR